MSAYSVSESIHTYSGLIAGDAVLILEAIGIILGRPSSNDEDIVSI
jgi:hypothetical protein